MCWHFATNGGCKKGKLPLTWNCSNPPLWNVSSIIEGKLYLLWSIWLIGSHVLGNVSPIQLIISHFSSVPIMQSLNLQVFWCVAFVHVHKQYWYKLDSRAIRCINLGYSPKKMGINVIILQIVNTLLMCYLSWTCVLY